MKDSDHQYKVNITLFLPNVLQPLLYLLCIVTLSLSCSSIAEDERTLPYVVHVGENDSSYYDQYLLDWKEIENRLGVLSLINTSIQVRDMNDDELLTPVLIDTNGDNVPDYIKVGTHLSTNESLRPFELLVGKKQKNRIRLKYENISSMNGLSVDFLTKSNQQVVDEYWGGSWINAIGGTYTDIYKNPSDLEIFSPGEWNYTNGFFVNALCYFDQLSGEDKYLSYVQQWLDLFITIDGTIDSLKYSRAKYRLDDILPGRALLYVYKKTGDEKYLKACDELLDQLKHQPRTSEGGYWHKKIYDWQMWLDGIYMSDVFLLQYADLLNKPHYYDEAIFQIQLIYKHTLDTVTGLLYHGWDESRSKIWADPETGRSPEFWGRSLGWYMMALVDALDYIPESHPRRNEILQMLQLLADKIAAYQDKETGMWYQVVNKADVEGNWPETSCTAMFAYTFMKAYKMGYLPETFNSSAEKAYETLKREYVYFNDSGKLYLIGTVKVGTLNVEVSNGSFEYYISVDRRVNDFKGIAALLYLAISDEYLKKSNPET